MEKVNDLTLHGSNLMGTLFRVTTYFINQKFKTISNTCGNLETYRDKMIILNLQIKS
jgi:hypothetical protein